MRSWSSRHTALVTLAEATRKKRAAVEQLSTLAASHRKALNECLVQLGQQTGSNDDLLAAVLHRCEDVISRIETANSERKSFQQELAKLKQQLPDIERQTEQAGAAVDQWRDQWELAIMRLGLDKDARPAEANTVLGAIDELFSKLKDADDLRERIDGIDRDADEFARTVGRLAQEMSPNLKDLPVEQAASDLYDRLDVALRAQTQLDELNKQLERERTKCEKARIGINRLRAAIETMCGEASCKSPDDLPEAERRSARRKELERELKKLNEQLHGLVAGATLEEFIHDASQCDPDQLPPSIERLNGEVELLEDEKSQVSETIGSERTERRRMDGSARAAEAQEEAEHLEAQIRSDAEQYVRLRLASAVLRGAIERYREKNQGPVLQRASDLFGDLTGGSFEALRADYNDKGEAVLVAVRPDGKQTVGVDGLSDGTECQLYLALRLAILETNLSNREPVPFIVDDILKDFDDDRAVAALKALAGLSEKTQVILFTHHRHLVQLAEENLDDTIVFTHVLDRTRMATDTVASRASST
jgi:uncharacterized protein YhaN